jgi:cytochrome c oxidase cbb3-type subunit III
MEFESALSGFWNAWVMGLIAVNLLLTVWLIWWSKKIPAGDAQSESETTGHVYDGLEEYNNPLPRWWLYMFYLTIIFGLGYFALYPGFGNVKGYLGWSQQSQYGEEMKDTDAKYNPIYNKYAAMPVSQIIKDDEAQKIGKRLFLNYCSVCHGTDARGSRNFPNLTDSDWLYGGNFDEIQTTVLNGRGGIMPPKGGLPMTDDELDNMVQYVMSLSGRKVDEAKAAQGKAKFAICSACHMPNGTGNKAMGSPNLTDDIWFTCAY